MLQERRDQRPHDGHPRQERRDPARHIRGGEGVQPHHAQQRAHFRGHHRDRHQHHRDRPPPPHQQHRPRHHAEQHPCRHRHPAPPARSARPPAHTPRRSERQEHIQHGASPPGPPPRPASGRASCTRFLHLPPLQSYRPAYGRRPIPESPRTACYAAVPDPLRTLTNGHPTMLLRLAGAAVLPRRSGEGHRRAPGGPGATKCGAIPSHRRLVVRHSVGCRATGLTKCPVWPLTPSPVV